jgi:hypothetical protein
LVRDSLRAGASALLALVIMLAGSLLLWIGVPVGWLYVGSQIQAKTDSIGTALGVMLVGGIASVIGLGYGLAWLNHKHLELREAHGVKTSRGGVLEPVLIVSAVIAVSAFALWFVVLQGPGPTVAPQ